MNVLTIHPDPSTVNTRLFNEVGREYNRIGKYTNTIPGTIAYREFWEEQTRLCLEGMEIGGVRITGLHYFYLNFCPILAFDERTGRKIIRLPDFIDMDYYFFLEIEQAIKNGQGMIVAKARRKGFSFKNAAMCVYYYNFFRESKSFIGAYLDEYAQSTMNMALEMLDFLNKHTAWYKRRQGADRKDYVQARYQDREKKTWHGYKSIIQTLTFKDNPSAAIGKSADLFLFEEAGKWSNLIESYQLTMPVFRDGGRMTGFPIIFGTGGDMDGGTQDFAKMFYDPERYFLRPFQNVWDDTNPDKACGLFVSSTWFWPLNKGETVKMPDDTEQLPFDEDQGISNHAVTKEYLLQERVKMRQTESRQTWESYLTQYPLMPREAFLKTTGNLFPVVQLSEWLAEVKSRKELSEQGLAVKLEWTLDNKVKKVITPNVFPITNFPHESASKLEGAVVIYEEPYVDPKTNSIPFGLYIAGTDPYDQDSSGTTSLGSTFIYKQFNQFDKTYSRVVAEYTGRPESAKEYYENLRKLLVYYNAQTLYENQLTGLKAYYEQQRCLYLLKEQPQIIKSISPSSKVARGYGIHMSKQIKRQAEIYLRDWLLEVRGSDEEGRPVYNFQTIFSVPLLEELISYDAEEGNFDRVIAMMLVMLHMEENHEILKITTASNEPDPFFREKLFQHNRPHYTVKQESSRPGRHQKRGPWF